MKLNQLHYFIHVAEMGSYTKAANFLDMTQSLLSRQIRQLELELQQSLLIRTGRGVMLTDSGKVMLEHARGIIHQVEIAKEEVSQGKLQGHISLGLPPTMARQIALPLIHLFRQRLPDAKLAIYENLSASIEESLHSGHLDIALLHNPSYLPDLDITYLTEEPLYLIASKQAMFSKIAFSLHEVATLPLILPSWPNTFRILVETELAKISQKPNVVLEMNSVQTILDLVIDQVGYAILSKDIFEGVVNADTLVAYPIIETPLISKLFLATSNKRTITRTQAIFIDILREVILRKSCC